MLSRNFCQKSVRVNFRKFHSVEKYYTTNRIAHDHAQKFSMKSTSLIKRSWFHGKNVDFTVKIAIGFYSTFPHFAGTKFFFRYMSWVFPNFVACLKESIFLVKFYFVCTTQLQWMSRVFIWECMIGIELNFFKLYIFWAIQHKLRRT